jgi:hypothetical protein
VFFVDKSQNICLEERSLSAADLFTAVALFNQLTVCLSVFFVDKSQNICLEERSLSAADLFTAVALFNQLTVCLSVFPVTIPIFIKGIISR